MMAARVDPAQLSELTEQVTDFVDTHELPAAQFAVAQHGELIHSVSFGAAQDHTRFVLQSAGRPVLAAAVWRLMSDYSLDISRTVASYIPEFASNGKEQVTVEQVLTHVAGFPLAPLKYPTMLSREGRLEAFARWRLTYDPGTRLEFHLTSAAWVLGEIAERLTGLTYRAYLRQAISEPLGLASLDVAVPIDQQADIAALTLIGQPLPEGGVDPWGPWYLARPEILAA
ncbi:MAG: hypothetical protein QOC92_723, partial [Acidimicrobiaceae bacterium]